RAHCSADLLGNKVLNNLRRLHSVVTAGECFYPVPRRGALGLPAGGWGEKMTEKKTWLIFRRRFFRSFVILRPDRSRREPTRLARLSAALEAGQSLAFLRDLQGHLEADLRRLHYWVLVLREADRLALRDRPGRRVRVLA